MNVLSPRCSAGRVARELPVDFIFLGFLPMEVATDRGPLVRSPLSLSETRYMLFALTCSCSSAVASRNLAPGHLPPPSLSVGKQLFLSGSRLPAAPRCTCWSITARSPSSPSVQWHWQAGRRAGRQTGRNGCFSRTRAAAPRSSFQSIDIIKNSKSLFG